MYPGRVHSGRQVAECVALVLRLLDCDLTPQDVAFLFKDRFGLSRASRLRRHAHVVDEGDRHKSVVAACKASPLVVVR